MIRETEEKYWRVKYTGIPTELKEQLKFILEDWPEVFRQQYNCDIENLEDISDESNYLDYSSQRIYFNKERILYGVGSSEIITANSHFDLIKKICSNADCKFLGKPDLLEE
jgi:hypothetical protein